jgi:hypothetical protein
MISAIITILTKGKVDLTVCYFYYLYRFLNGLYENK